jgi:cytoskeletal protein RodZ
MAGQIAGGVGATLREARERRGMSLRHIANATKISVAALEALERNDISRLPGGIFSRAFVRSYAAEVGLDPEHVVQEFIQQFPQDSVTAGHPTSRRIEDPEQVESNRRVASVVLWLLVVSIPVGALLMYVGLGRRSATPPVPQPPASMAAPAPAPVPTPSAGDSPALPPAPATPAIPPSVQGGSASATAGVADRQATATASTDRPVVVDLSASAPCWVSATVDGERIVERELQAGDRHQFAMHRELVLRAGNAAAVTLAFDGADARPLGKSGETVTVRLNLANYKDYLTAR